MEVFHPQHSVMAVFGDKAVAQQAAKTLVESGIPASTLHFHERGLPARNGAGVIVDEYATGGFLTSFMGLLDGLLGGESVPQEARSYAELLRFEGVALSVDSPSAAEADRADALLRQAGAVDVARSATPSPP
jgi:hypothetical protein